MRIVFASAFLLILFGAPCRALTQAVPSARLKSGEDLYAELCALCHGNEGEGYLVEGAPALRNQDFLAAVTDEFLFAAIASGRRGTKMSAWSVRAEGPLEDVQIHALVNFLRNWQSVPSVELNDRSTIIGSISEGARTYRVNCSECHGENGRALGAPDLNNAEFLKTASDGFIRYAIVHGRRDTPMKAFANELTLTQIDDLVAFIRSWENEAHYD